MTDAVAAAAALLRARPALALATAGPDGAPEASFLPFAVAGDALAVVASGLSRHTANLLRSPRASVLVVAGDDGDDVFARARLTLDVVATPLRPASAEAERAWAALARRHGPGTTGVLAGLPDFTAFSLRPTAGRAVLGFASAFPLDEAEALRAVRAGGGAA